MSKYRYNPERWLWRLNDSRLTDDVVEQIREHAQKQLDDDCINCGFKENPTTITCVRRIIEAAMIECPELFVKNTGNGGVR